MAGEALIEGGRCGRVWLGHRRLSILDLSDAGADAGGEILADAMTVIETAKLSGCNPEAYLADILARIREHDPARIDELLPWNWKHRGISAAKAA